MRQLLDTHTFIWYVVIATLPFHHRDPFDRIILAQAMVEQLPILSADTAFDAYAIERFW